MASWRDYARRADPLPDDVASSANSAKSPAIGADDAPNGPIGTNGTATLPAALAAGVRRLKAMGVPREADPRAWKLAVADAMRLASEGWAAQAVALGWSALDLFGGVVEADGDPYGDGLAVWLSGRRIRAICATFAVVEDARGCRSYFNRPRPAGARLLWAMGCGG